MANRLFTYISTLVIICCLYVGYLYASDMQKMTHEDYKIIKDKIEELKHRIQKLEKQQQDSSDIHQVINQINQLNDEIEEYSEIMSQVERKSLLDLIDVNAELRTQFNWYDFKGHDYEPYSGIKNSPERHERVRMMPTNQLRFNLRAQLSDNFKFSSRLNMTRHWSDDDIPIYPELNFLNAAREPSNLEVKVERAYIDYFFEPIKNLPFALTFGRLPSTDGPPTDLKEKTTRKSTYPGLAYDCESDGLALSVLLDHYLPLQKPAFRTVWVRRVDDNTQYFLGEKLSSKYGVYRKDESAMDTLNIFIAQFEAYLPEALSHTLLMINYVWIPKVPSSDLRYNPELQGFYDDNNTSLYADVPDSEGKLSKLTCFIESKNCFQTQLDWFIGISFLRTKAEGALRFMFESPQWDIPPILARNAYETYKDKPFADALKPLTNAPPPIGLLNSDGTSDRSAQALHMGFRYTLPLPKFKHPMIGCEYNHGSQYWFGINAGSSDELHKLDIRGTVWDLYYIQPITRHFLTRLSYKWVDYDYDDGMSFYHGEPMAIDHRVSHISFVLDARF